jgi:hypothetical protein
MWKYVTRGCWWFLFLKSSLEIILKHTRAFLANDFFNSVALSALKIHGVFVITYVLFVGYALKMLTELLASFLEQDSIKQQYKGRLVGAVLIGYLSLRRLVVQRTRLIDDTQEKLLELLEEMTTGTEVYITSCLL